MMKKIISFCLCMSLVPGLCVQASAYTSPQTVRVGLSQRYKDVSNVPIANQTVSVGYENSGMFLSEGVISSSSGFSISPANAYYVSQGQNAGSYAQARQMADHYLRNGQPCVVAFLERGNWQVYFGGYASSSEADAARQALGGTVTAPNARRTALSDGGREVVVFENTSTFAQLADGGGGFLTLADRNYRGVVEFGRYTGGLVTAVNVLSLDEYLYSAVASEMPSSWHIEALKAQAVAARCYAVTRMGIHRDGGYELCDGVHCQVYLGAGNEADSTTRAVRETSGVLVYYAGTPINATFFSSSGGVTEDGDKVWRDPVPYLKSVPELAETSYKQWVRSFTLLEITALLRANNANIGDAVSVSVSPDSVSGRITKMTVTGTTGSQSFYKDNVRTFFAQSSGGSLESTNFTLSNGSLVETDTKVCVLNTSGTSEAALKTLSAFSSASGTVPLAGAVVQGADQLYTYQMSEKTAVSDGGTDVIFSGKGWGHGVGMSQYGAKGMAEAGYTYEQILKHYYTGVEIGNR